MLFFSFELRLQLLGYATSLSDSLFCATAFDGTFPCRSPVPVHRGLVHVGCPTLEGTLRDSRVRGSDSFNILFEYSTMA